MPRPSFGKSPWAMNADKGVIAGRLPRPPGSWLRVGLVLVLLGAAGCTRKEESAASPPGGAAKSDSAPRAVQNPAAPGIADAVAMAPPPFLFTGVSWLGKNGFVALQDTRTQKSAWYRLGETIDRYELAGLKDGLLLVRIQGKEFLLPLKGIELTQAAGGPAQDVTATPPPSPTIKVWVNGVGVEATPDKMPPEFLKAYNDSKEALLNAKVSKNLEPQIAQALDSKIVVVSGPDGMKRSDFPPDLAAKLDDATLAKINAAIKAHLPAPPNSSPGK